MDIVYTINTAFLPYAAVSMTSLCCFARGPLRFFVLGRGLSEEDKRKLEQHLARRPRTEVRFVDLDDIRSYFDFSFDTAGFHPIVLARLILDRLLPDDVGRLLYLDADTLVRGDIAGLWETDLRGCAIGACIEPTYSLKRKAALGLRGRPYFNAGVLLIDLPVWREKKTGEEILRYYRAHSGKLFANDQDAINASQKGKIRPLPVEYNYQNTYDYYSYRLLEKNCDYPVPSEKEIERARRNPCIVHFLGEERPWRVGNTNRFRKEYARFLTMTPWAGQGFEAGWELYFRFWRMFNSFTRPFPMLRLFVIQTLMPLMLKTKHR